MEVHHHPEVEKKGFKEYLLEGLMIFLAVLMGFIAENIREGITEHKRAAEFAGSYYGDIKKDTLLLHQALRFSAHKIAAIDSMIAVLHQPETLSADTIFYRKGLVSTQVLPFEPTTGSYEQIKSSGAIREFKQRMVDLMNEYDLQARNVVRREDITQKFTTDQFIPFIIDHGNLEVSYDIMADSKITHEVRTNWDPALRKKYLNLVVLVKISTLRSVQEYRKQLVVADKVLSELKKEYRLE
ncbi:MAG: hypothetical protein JST32_07150 [Bacteroidetes bacterium]|nr:hypothetical protein [Bacteroidota bacterium]